MNKNLPPSFFSILTFFLAILFCLPFHFSSAQKQANNWYFGSGAGVDFNSGAPVSVIGGMINTGEGCATISDTSGNLLFYTDGQSVWNKNHVQMPNGFGLLGGYSSSMAALIIPMPGSDSLYYIFTTAEQAGSDGFEYSIVDLSLQGGLGDVVVKNVLLLTPVGEKLTAIQQTGTNNVWVVTHEYYTANFYSYLLTDTGVNTIPVITNVGSIHTGFGTDNAIGYMKISPDGSKLALALSRSWYFELFDFDASTGIPSNPIVLPASNYTYGIEFSRNGKFLYASEFDNKIYQYDLTAGGSTAIINSQILVGTPSGFEIGSIQMASDGKIYAVKNSDSHLSAINYPDSAGLLCGFVDNAVLIVPGTFGIEGLPNFVPTFFSDPGSLLPQSNFQATDTGICAKFCVDFFDASSNNPTSWQWLFPGGVPSSSTDENPSNICYQVPGNYDVTLITSNSNGTDTTSLPGYITVYATPPFPVITQTNYTLTSSVASTYQWQLNSIDIPGATNQSYDVQQSGLYSVFIADEHGCVSSSSTYVLIEGIATLLNDAAISVYPNPSNGSFVIEWSDISSSARPVSIQIHNVLGQIVYSSDEASDARSWSADIHSAKKEIDLTYAPSGIYLLEIGTENTFLSKSLVLQH